MLENVVLSYSTTTKQAVFFNAGCNEHVFFFLTLEKNWRRSVLSFSRKMQNLSTPTHSNSI